MCYQRLCPQEAVRLWVGPTARAVLGRNDLHRSCLVPAGPTQLSILQVSIFRGIPRFPGLWLAGRVRAQVRLADACEQKGVTLALPVPAEPLNQQYAQKQRRFRSS